jgi:hypothetical protein
VKVYVHRSLWAEREGLTEPRYVLESDLQPGTICEWTVRARYRIDGSRRRTEWTEREDTWSRSGTIAAHERRYIPLNITDESAIEDRPADPRPRDLTRRRRP